MNKSLFHELRYEIYLFFIIDGSIYIFFLQMEGLLRIMLESSMSWLPIANPDFIIAIITFEVGTIAVAIPLSLDILSRLSERYKSDVLIKIFKGDISTNNYVIIVVSKIVLGVILIFSSNPEKIPFLWNCLAWIFGIFFIWVAFCFAKILIKITLYISDSDFITEVLFKNAEESIKE